MSDFNLGSTQKNGAVFQTLAVGPLQCNCRILVCPTTGHAALVDPGDEAEKILQKIQKIEENMKKKIEVKFLFHTHAHFDHFGATRRVKEILKAPEILLHKDDQKLYQMLKMQGSIFGFHFEDPLPIDRFIRDEEEIRVGDLKLTVLHTPGHSPGGVCLRLHDDSDTGAQEAIFSGDTLFRESVGRTDLWGGDSDLLVKSIKTRLFTLDPDTKVCPGHGPDSTIGYEKKENPFLT